MNPTTPTAEPAAVPAPPTEITRGNHRYFIVKDRSNIADCRQACAEKGVKYLDANRLPWAPNNRLVRDPKTQKMFVRKPYVNEVAKQPQTFNWLVKAMETAESRARTAAAAE